MKKRLITLAAALIVAGASLTCRATKLDKKTGNKVPTGNTKAWKKGHPNGAWVNGKYIR